MDNRASMSRRDILKAGAAVAAGGVPAFAQEAGERPSQATGAEVINPLGRVPMSFIIDDSTCLVNLAYFGIPQFAETWPANYKQDWRKLPREIPDSFVRKFDQWCAGHGIKGKYSIVPNPACVGFVDRFLPGWTERELADSINLVRELMTPNWDIHPEMVTHTRVLDIKTGKPYPDKSEKFMENWGWSQDKSADELASYMSYALRILRNIGLECEGITTPGGFGSRNRANLAKATLESCRDVFNAEIPHYFRDLFTDDRSVAPRVYYASDLNGDNPKCVVSVIGCTGDWFGGWDGLKPGSVDKFITEDLKGGRLPQVIDRGEPAILVCHWPGIYFNGEEIGFNIFKEVVRRVHARYDNLIWMKLSEIARYWAAKELTHVEAGGSVVRLDAPFSTERFTMRVRGLPAEKPHLMCRGKRTVLSRVHDRRKLQSGTWCAEGDGFIVCFDLAKGRTQLHM